MSSGVLKRYLLLLVFSAFTAGIFAQDNVPLGIHYQAVARDNYGNEIVNRKINVKFSIIKSDPLGTVVYQELHQDVYTSRFGVFSLIIGQGVPTGNAEYGELSQVSWEEAYHFLKVEVKFENDFMDMGTMQFLAVPYALFAKKSLEPGPQGPKGDTGAQGVQGEKGEPGDPATDDQTLSVINVDGSDYLAISGGNQVKISTIEKDGDPSNEIQDLTLSSDKLKITGNSLATEWDLSPYRQSLSWDPVSRILNISGTASPVNLTELKDDTDADPGNEIQDIELSGDTLRITGNESSDGVYLGKYLDADPEDEIQDLQLISNNLSVTGNTEATEIDLSAYLDNTDNQTLEYTESTKSLSISGGNSITLDNMVAFRAKKTISETGLSYMTDYDFVAASVDYDDGSSYDESTGIFTVPQNGIYTFNIGFTATGSGDARIIKLVIDGTEEEILNSGISAGTSLTRSIILKLNAAQTVKIVINTGASEETGTGSFSGFKVY